MAGPYTTLRIALALSSGSKAVTVLQSKRIVIESNVDRTLFNYILISDDWMNSTSYYGVSEDEVRSFLANEKIDMGSRVWLPV